MSNYNVIHCTSQDDWLSKRVIGGSSAASILGMNPYMTNIDSWKIFTGRKEREDISNKECVIYGHKAEDPIRQLFTLDNEKEFEVIAPTTIEKEGYIEIFEDKNYPFLTATLDGILINKKTGEKGIYEGKTTRIVSSMQKEKWKNKIPNNYFIQCLHYLGVMGEEYKFVILHVQSAYSNKDGEEWFTRKSYLIKREDHIEDIKYLREKEITFWKENVEKDIEPNLLIQVD